MGDLLRTSNFGSAVAGVVKQTVVRPLIKGGPTLHKVSSAVSIKEAARMLLAEARFLDMLPGIRVG